MLKNKNYCRFTKSDRELWQKLKNQELTEKEIDNLVENTESDLLMDYAFRTSLVNSLQHKKQTRKCSRCDQYKETVDDNARMLEENRNIFRKRRDETNADLTKIKTKLEITEKKIGQIETTPISNYSSIKHYAESTNQLIKQVIRDIVFLLPDEDNPYLKDICDGCCLPKSSCNCE